MLYEIGHCGRSLCQDLWELLCFRKQITHWQLNICNMLHRMKGNVWLLLLVKSYQRPQKCPYRDFREGNQKCNIFQLDKFQSYFQEELRIRVLKFRICSFNQKGKENLELGITLYIFQVVNSFQKMVVFISKCLSFANNFPVFK